MAVDGCTVPVKYVLWIIQHHDVSTGRSLVLEAFFLICTNLFLILTCTCTYWNSSMEPKLKVSSSIQNWLLFNMAKRTCACLWQGPTCKVDAPRSRSYATARSRPVICVASVNNNSVKRTRMLWRSASCCARLCRHPDWAAALSAPGHAEDTWFILFYHNPTLGFTIVGNSWSAETLDGFIIEALFGMASWPWKWSGAPEAWVGSQDP